MIQPKKLDVVTIPVTASASISTGNKSLTLSAPVPRKPSRSTWITPTVADSVGVMTPVTTPLTMTEMRNADRTPRWQAAR